MQRLGHNIKVQSAMEYLMTYGWAILIIAVVLGALFQLGVFNPNSFAPKARPGSCQVIRPYGPGNTNYISLAGTCNGQLPQYVALFSLGDQISATAAGLPSGSSARALTMWFQVPSNGGYLGAAGWQTVCSPQGVTDLGQWSNGGRNLYFWGDAADYASSFAIAPNEWHFAAATYAAGATTVTVYFDGNSETGGLSGGLPLNTPADAKLYLGSNPCSSSYNFRGMLANIQVYNASLSSNDIAALYNEGIGGAPIDLFHLIGWWPLNGNANDYSGNKYDGAGTGVTYTSSWINTYSAP